LNIRKRTSDFLPSIGDEERFDSVFVIMIMVHSNGLLDVLEVNGSAR
jgi:hypothetical protein